VIAYQHVHVLEVYKPENQGHLQDLGWINKEPRFLNDFREKYRKRYVFCNKLRFMIVYRYVQVLEVYKPEKRGYSQDLD
jgi:hypothetical protein